MKYDAFISYKHAELDTYIAKKVHKSLETYKIPKSVAKKNGKKSIKRVFRDQEELPIGSSLTYNIESALAESNFLIVICSPETPKSIWVKREIQTFIKMHGRDKVLAVLVEGEPCDSFPEELLVDEFGNTVEPLAADVRGATKSEINTKFKTEILRLIASVIGCSYDDLKQRHRERQMRKYMFAFSMLFVLVAAFGVYSTYKNMMIQKSLNDKSINQSKFYASTSRKLAEEGDYRAAALIALEALPVEDDRPFVPQAQVALTDALKCYRSGDYYSKDSSLIHEDDVKDFVIDQTGKYIASYDDEQNVYFWSTDNQKIMFTINPSYEMFGSNSSIVGLHIFKDKFLVVSTYRVALYTFEGKLLKSIESEKSINGCLFDDETLKFSYSTLEELYLYDEQTLSLIKEFKSDSDDYFQDTGIIDGKNQQIYIVKSKDFACSLVKIDLNTSKETVLKKKMDIVYKLQQASDGDLMILSGETSFSALEKDTLDLELEKINSDGKTTFAKDFTIKKSLSYHFSLNLGEYIVVTLVDKCYVFDMKGKEISSFNTTLNIIESRIVGDFGFFAGTEGLIEAYDILTGEKASSYSINVNREIEKAYFYDYSIYLGGFNSPEIIVESYVISDDCESIAEKDDTIDYMVIDGRNKYYATISNKLVEFYDANTNKVVSSFEIGESQYVMSYGFTDSNDFMLFTNDNHLFSYNVDKDELNDVNVVIDSMYNTNLSNNGRYAVSYSFLNLQVYDLTNNELTQNDFENDIYCASISNDGKFAVVTFDDGSTYEYDIKTKKLSKKICDKVLASVINNDSTIIACVTSNNTLVTYDCKTKETNTFEDVKYSKAFYGEFSPDSKYFVTAGKNFKLRILDIQNNKWVYSGDIEDKGYIDTIQWCDDFMTIRTGNGIQIRRLEDFEQLAYIENGKFYNEECNCIYGIRNREIFRFKYLSLDDLIKKAKKIYGDDSLSAEEKVKYNIEQ